METINLMDMKFSNDDEYFMTLALLTAQRSKDPRTQVGACIVDKNNNLLSLGYNAMPRGCHDDETSWVKRKKSIDDKLLYVCHAELNAIANSKRMIDGCTLYVTLFPCNECAKLIIQFNIKRIIYLWDTRQHKLHTIVSKRMLQRAQIEYVQFNYTTKQIIIDLPNEINSNGIDDQREYNRNEETREESIRKRRKHEGTSGAELVGKEMEAMAEQSEHPAGNAN